MSLSRTNPGGFRALLFSQFCGGLNDNLLKVLVSLFAVNAMMSGGGGMLEVVLTGICFVLPFVLFSPFAGSLADRYPKARVIQGSKLIELLVAIAAAIFLAHQSYWGLLVCLFFIGAHSALMSPSKYGVLPDLLAEDELSKGNGFLEMVTFASCIAGTALGGLLQALFGKESLVPGGSLVLFASLGFIASLRVPLTSVHNAQSPIVFSPLSVVGTVKRIWSVRGLRLAMFGMAYLWSLASLYQLNLQLYAKSLIHLDDLRTAICMTVLGIGIGVGSVVAGRVSEGKVELGLVPIGSAGIGLWSTLLFFTQSFTWTLVILVLLGLSSGFFIVPLNSYFQFESPEAERGKFIGASNVVTYVGTLLAYTILFAASAVSVDPGELFLIAGLLGFALTVYICRLMPEMLLRCINWVVTHTLYRVRVHGLENLPRTGGALIVCNHVAYVDPPIILAASKRPVRFFMYKDIYESRPINPIAKAMRAIPVSANESPKSLLRALNEGREAIKNGELVCIFAEGELTRIGHLLQFKKGLERIVKDLDAPIIPAYIDQIWGSIFSFRDGKCFWKVPKEIPYPVTLAFGKPLPSTSQAHEVRQAIQEMSAEISSSRTTQYPSLQSAFLKNCRRKLTAPCFIDSSGKRLSYISTLIASLCLKDKLKVTLGPNRMVGVILPPSVAGALTNLALSFDGRVPVNLNFTASADSLRYALEKCEIEDIITNRAFLEKIGMEARPEMLFVEDLLKDVPTVRKIFWGASSLLLPPKIFLRYVLKDKTKRGDLATVIFSSGSTAEPKGVMLSHGNIASNIESLYELFQFERRDAVLGVLPFFHSFGYTATLWLPLLCGIRAVYHPSPMDAGIIGELVEKEKVTLLMSTPTFLLGYIRKCTPENFRSLRFVITGAEKLKDRIAQSFAEKFGITPMEGFGATELAPVAMMNIPNFRDSIVDQVGHKPGTVGHPLPGVSIRIVDPDTFTLLPPGQEGLLLVRGPNVMIGYLANPEKTAEVIRDGWYVTGDIARVDDDGFVTITDRLSRFSKIAGEMVPHVKIEEAIHKALGEVETMCVVTSISDEKKGEKLVVLSLKELDVGSLVKRLGEDGMPNLWIPKKENFHAIQQLPMLGSGKLDLKAVKKIAEERSNGTGQSSAAE